MTKLENQLVLMKYVRVITRGEEYLRIQCEHMDMIFNGMIECDYTVLHLCSVQLCAILKPAIL